MNLDHDLRDTQPARPWNPPAMERFNRRVATWLADPECSLSIVMTNPARPGAVPLLVADAVTSTGVDSFVRADPPLPCFDLFPRLSRLARKVRRARS